MVTLNDLGNVDLRQLLHCTLPQTDVHVLNRYFDFETCNLKFCLGRFLVTLKDRLLTLVVLNGFSFKEPIENQPLYKRLV